MLRRQDPDRPAPPSPKLATECQNTSEMLMKFAAAEPEITASLLRKLAARHYYRTNKD